MQTNTSTGAQSPLVGAWRLVSTEQRLTDGTVRPSPIYGPNGTGYLMYSATGRMCVILVNPDRPTSGEGIMLPFLGQTPVNGAAENCFPPMSGGLRGANLAIALRPFRSGLTHADACAIVRFVEPRWPNL